MGFVTFVPIFILLYLKSHGEKWPLSVLLAIITFVELKGFFVMMLKVYLYKGYIPDLLMRYDTLNFKV